MSAARRISRLAVGDPTIGPALGSQTYAVPIALMQHDRMSEDLSFGSRGGMAIRHHFPLDGEYVVKVRLRRTVYDFIVNLHEPHDLEVRLDGKRIVRWTVGGAPPGKPAPLSFSGNIVAAGEGVVYPSPDWEEYMTAGDKDLEVRFPVEAGTRVVGVSFVAQSWEREGVFQPRLREYAPVRHRGDGHIDRLKFQARGSCHGKCHDRGPPTTQRVRGRHPAVTRFLSATPPIRRPRNPARRRYSPCSRVARIAGPSRR